MPESSQINSVKQEGIDSGGGDIAGGNIDKSKNLYFNQQYQNDQYLSHLYQTLAADMKSEKRIDGTCDPLLDFVATQADDVIGLEQKLINGGMGSQVPYAKDCKERYAKNLSKYVMYETAQMIHAYLLAKVESGFASSVLPNIPNTPPEQKLKLMRTTVLDPLENLLGKNPLGFHAKEVDGMAFFLTGKCKLKWEA